jgi:ABC-2 type transport system permease protein
MSPRRIAAVIVKEGREVLRDPVTLGVSLLMPLVMLFLFGYAIRLDVPDIPLSIVDQDRSAESRAFVDRYAATGQFRLVAHHDDARAAERDLQQGRARVAVVIPPRFAQRLARRETVPVQVLIDGTYASTSILAAGYSEAIAGAFGASAPPSRISLETRVWYNPALAGVNDVVPALYAVILMAFPPLLTALAIVREKETGSIQQIYASPLTSAEFIAGKLVPYSVIAFVQMMMVIVAGLLWFEVPFRGGPLFLLGVSVLYVLCTVGIGLLISTVTRTQLVAMLAALIVTLMPSFLFSGLLFPVFTMPWLLQQYTALFPVRYFVDISRGVTLKGAGAVDLWVNVAALLAYTVAVFTLAAARLRKKVA